MGSDSTAPPLLLACTVRGTLYVDTASDTAPTTPPSWQRVGEEGEGQVVVTAGAHHPGGPCRTASWLHQQDGWTLRAATAAALTTQDVPFDPQQQAMCAPGGTAGCLFDCHIS
jgi:hypothetical protein